MTELILVDATYELFRAYFGAPPRTGGSGIELGATLAFARSMVALRRRKEGPHMALAFDSVVESFRNRLFPGYKTSAGVPASLLCQFSLAEELAGALGFAVFGMTEFEADDALATLAEAHRTEPSLARIIIASPDKDLMQCVVGTRVITWDRLRERTYDEVGVLQKLGIPPASVPDYLALVGDSADGIPGISRWGATGTGTVLRHYGHLEAIPDESANWTVSVRGAQSLAQNLAKERPQALLYRTLATLRRDVPIDINLDALSPRTPDDQLLAELSARWQEPALRELGAH
jgi:5'-3' exonuclease